MTGLIQSSSASTFMQQFMQFPRHSTPRTLLYTAVVNVAFYQLASLLARMVENKYPSVDRNKKIAAGVLVFGGLTALFNAVQFRLFNFQLGRVASLAIGVAITAVMTFAYFILNRPARVLDPINWDVHAQQIAGMDVKQESVAQLFNALSISGDGEASTFLYLLQDRFARYLGYLGLNQPGAKDALLELIALRAKGNQPTNPREAQECLDEILGDLRRKPQERQA